MSSQIKFHPSGSPWSHDWKKNALLIYDQHLSQFSAFKNWSKKFSAEYAVQAGEDLKDLRHFSKHIEKIVKKIEPIPNRHLTIVVAGGGSIGDFGGFVASILKRGVRLVMVPTTWLAAVDSAHGGKNGLNSNGAKNQVGTIYEPDEVHLVYLFLKQQPLERVREAGGEVLKISLLAGIDQKKFLSFSTSKDLWRILPNVIKAKLKIVRQDPFEKKGIRHLLNLGHTMGHVFEAELKLPHGIAVAYGLIFATSFSRYRGYCSEQAFEKIISHPLWLLFFPSKIYLKCLSLSEKRVRDLLLKDKKRDLRSQVRFIFLRAFGKPHIENVTVADLVQEMKRQRMLLRAWYLHG